MEAEEVSREKNLQIAHHLNELSPLLAVEHQPAMVDDTEDEPMDLDKTKHSSPENHNCGCLLT